MSKKKLIVLGIFLIFGIATFIFIQYKKTHISTDDAYITNDIYWVNPKVSGTIEKVFMGDNEYVKKGKVLAVIDQKPYRIALQRAEANVSLYEAKIEEAKAAIEAAKAEVNLVVAKLKKAEWDFKRAKKLFKNRVISKDAYEKYLTNYNVLKATLKAKQDALKRAEVSLNSLKEALKAAKAAEHQAELNLSYTYIKAPADGFITKKNIEVGKFASPQLPICAIVPKSGAWIVANYKESQIGKIKPGMKVKIEIDAYPSKEFEGRVASIQYGTGEVFSLFPPENASGNWIKVVQRVPVKIVFDKKPDVPLRVGMSVETTVLVK
ncbi:HlyD family secretion protein [Hippea alviniae]|uniref:HlyD family secretion protein n=1 Tax=Hippea alviniae TaxID=1279027 RepID=UPI0003B348CD|nr:HlyD family secretion protein [Hippea alviniae]